MTDEFPEPPELIHERPWLCWREVWDPAREKTTKRPVDVHTGGLASTSDPDTWTDFEQACEYHAREDTDTTGIGFVFTEDGPLTGVDIDNGFDPVTLEWEPWAQRIIDYLNTYTDISPSDTGGHPILVGEKPGDRCKTDYEDGEVEMYDHGRFFTYTGDHAEGTPTTVEERQEELENVYTTVFGEPAEDGDTAPSREPSEPVDLDDAELVEKAMNAKNGDEFARLWNGDTSGYTSHSEADLGMNNYLAFWTGGDRRRMDRLFRDSGLYRDKWDEEHAGDGSTYGDMTIDTALAGTSEFYTPGGSGATAEPDVEPTGESWPESAPTWDERLRNRCAEAREYEQTISAKRHETDIVSDLLDDYVFITPEGTDDNPENDPLYVYDPDAGHFRRRGGRFIRDELETYAPGGVLSTHSTTNIVKRVKWRTGVDRSTLNGGADDHRLINFSNGVYNIDAGELLEHDPDYRFTARINAAYDPTEEGDVDAWDERLHEWTGDPIDVKTLYEWLGICLSWDTYVQKFVLLHGPAGNGKGTFFRCLRKLFAPEHTSAVAFDQLTTANHRFATAKLDGSLINIDDDFTSGSISHKELNRLLNVTGGGTILAEHKGENMFDLTVRTQFMFATNELPRFAVENDSVARRLLEIEFPKQFTKQDDGNKDYRPEAELQAELTNDAALQGLLTRAVDGLHRYLDNGEMFTLERERGTDRERFAQYRRDSDPIRAFAADGLEQRHGFGIPKDIIYNTFTDYCDATGNAAPSRDVFFRKLGELPDLASRTVRPRVGEYDGGDRIRCRKNIWFTPTGLTHLTTSDRADLQVVANAVHNRDGWNSALYDSITTEFDTHPYRGDHAAQGAAATAVAPTDGGATQAPEQVTQRVLTHLDEHEGTDTLAGIAVALTNADDTLEPDTVADAVDQLHEKGHVIRDGSDVTRNR